MKKQWKWAYCLSHIYIYIYIYISIREFQDFKVKKEWDIKPTLKNPSLKMIPKRYEKTKPKRQPCEGKNYIFEICKLQIKNIFPTALKIKQLWVCDDHFGMLRAIQVLLHVSEKCFLHLLR